MFDQSLPLVLKNEGGYVNNPKDPGGETNKGITKAVYDAWRRKKGQPVQSVRLISDAEVHDIYKANYWDAVKGDNLPEGVNYVVFDGAVNSGPGQSVKWLQRALGVTDDGLIGPKTIAAANAFPDKKKLVDAICAQRLKFLQSLSTWSTFGRGWADRVNRVALQGRTWTST